MTPRPRSLLVFLFALGAFLLAGALASPARAEDEVDPAEALLDQLDELRKAENVGGLTDAVAKVPEVYKASENKSLKGKLTDMLGKIVGDDDLGGARMAAVEALVGIDDPDEAWKELRRELPDRKAEEASELDIAIVKAVGTFQQSRALKPLYELAGKAKNNDLAVAAVEALGSYAGTDDRTRVGVLEELMDIGVKTRPGQSTTTTVSEEARERWSRIGPALKDSLNHLTGQELPSFEDWEAFYKEHKRRPREMFRDSGD